ncbi:MAG: ECF-type sigma factor [Myxococcota bacterium]
MSAGVAPPHEITALLLAHAGGDREAMNTLMPLIYARLRTIAHHRLSGEGRSPFETTALVHEAYLKLVDQTRSDWRGRAHFFALASVVMRRILIDAARARNRDKRNDGAPPEALGAAVGTPEGPVDPEPIYL